MVTETRQMPDPAEVSRIVEEISSAEQLHHLQHETNGD